MSNLNLVCLDFNLNNQHRWCIELDYINDDTSSGFQHLGALLVGDGFSAELYFYHQRDSYDPVTTYVCKIKDNWVALHNPFTPLILSRSHKTTGRSIWFYKGVITSQKSINELIINDNLDRLNI